MFPRTKALLHALQIRRNKNQSNSSQKQTHARKNEPLQRFPSLALRIEYAMFSHYPIHLAWIIEQDTFSFCWDGEDVDFFHHIANHKGARDCASYTTGKYQHSGDHEQWLHG